VNGRDLGTYHLRVVFEDGRGFIETWNTGLRYERGDQSVSPLDARPIHPTWEDEASLLATMIYAHTDGNMGCDCNRELSLARAANSPRDLDSVDCGDKINLASLTAIRPNGDFIPLMEGCVEVWPNGER
jgi:hypothetical protein